MNTSQIVQEVAKEMGQDEFIGDALDEFFHRCLSKLVEHSGVEPVAIVDDCELFSDHHGPVYAMAYLQSGTKLYTEAQYIAAQQRTAEACAKVCDKIDEEYEGEDVLGTWCSEAIRNGEWREYL